jgi:MarR family transcriptional regulator, transcriptional regulator for hemolysin
MQMYDFENSVGFIVNRSAKAFVKALDTELRERVGVTFGQWKVIVMLVNENGSTQKEIADRLGLEGPTLIPIIDKMEEERLVIRKVDPADRRNNRIYRTEKADGLWDMMIECALKIREVSLRGIPEQDINVMRKVLEKISQNLRMEFDVGCTVADSIANTATPTAATTTTARKKKS